MNGIDIASLCVIFLSTVTGFFRGFISSFLGFMGWVIAITVNHYMFPHIEPFIELRVHSKALTFLFGYVGGLVVLLFLMAIVNFTISTLLSGIRKGLFDKSFGLTFGLFRGIIIVAALLFCFEIVFVSLKGEELKNDQIPSILATSETFKIFKNSEKGILENIPQTFSEKLYPPSDKKLDEVTLQNIARQLDECTSPQKKLQINELMKDNKLYLSDKQLLILKIRNIWPAKNCSLSVSEIKILEEIVK